MKSYSSNDEYFGDIASLATRMELAGNSDAAVEVRRGLSCVNGLTDGWAMLMESLEQTIVQHGNKLPKDQVVDLESAFEAAKKAVYRL